MIQLLSVELIGPLDKDKELSEGAMEKDSSESGSDVISKPCSHPKRGAIPTPKEIIERAPPYVPESHRANDDPASQSTQSDEEQHGEKDVG